MAINFPDNPNIGDSYTGPNGRTWTWNGSAWDSKNRTPVAGANITNTQINFVDSDGNTSFTVPLDPITNQHDTDSEITSDTDYLDIYLRLTDNDPTNDPPIDPIVQAALNSGTHGN